MPRVPSPDSDVLTCPRHFVHSYFAQSAHSSTALVSLVAFWKASEGHQSQEGSSLPGWRGSDGEGPCFPWWWLCLTEAKALGILAKWPRTRTETILPLLTDVRLGLGTNMEITCKSKQSWLTSHKGLNEKWRAWGLGHPSEKRICSSMCWIEALLAYNIFNSIFPLHKKYFSHLSTALCLNVKSKIIWVEQQMSLANQYVCCPSIVPEVPSSNPDWGLQSCKRDF